MKKPKNYKMIDSDKDGISDYDEINKYGTDPNNPDTDGDGLTDGYEIKIGTNPKIKDFFIPNKENNYRPMALRPKRLLFYGASALITKIIVFFVVVSFPLSAWLTPNILYEEGRKIITLTNEIRNALDLNTLRENQQLNDAAMYKVQDMIINQYFAHTAPRGSRLSDWLKKTNYNYLFAGENLAIGFSGAQGVIDAWKKSPTHYANIIDPDFKDIGVGIMSGNYNNYDTVLIAQYFGSQRQENIAETVVIKTENTATSTTNPENQKQKNVKTENHPEEQATITIKNVPGANNSQIIKAEAVLSENIKNANVSLGDKTIELNKNSENTNEWSGNLITEKEEQKTITPAIIKTVDTQGNISMSDIKTENIVPIKTSLGDQYMFMKSYRPDNTNSLFTFASIYYKIILFITSILLLVNILIKIKIQKPDIVISSLFLIMFMVIFILY